MNSEAQAIPVEQTTIVQSPSERCNHAKRAFNAEGFVVALACDLWACDHCRKINAWRWAQRIRYGIALRLDTEPWFWTLTLPAWVQSAAKGYEILPRRWDNFRKTLQRTRGDFCYAAFVEGQPHRSDMPHFHIITFHPAPRRLKDLAVHCGFGYQADEREIDGPQAVSYVTKYASKSAPQLPRHFRRVRVSRGWPALPEPEYEVPVYPIKTGEALSGYLRRIACTLGRSVADVRDVWLDHTRDIY